MHIWLACCRTRPAREAQNVHLATNRSAGEQYCHSAPNLVEQKSRGHTTMFSVCAVENQRDARARHDRKVLTCVIRERTCLWVVGTARVKNVYVVGDILPPKLNGARKNVGEHFLRHYLCLSPTRAICKLKRRSAKDMTTCSLSVCKNGATTVCCLSQIVVV